MLKEELGAELRPYIILGTCNPPLAHRALHADPGIGLLLPCGVIVYDNGDQTSTIQMMDPEATLGLVGDNASVRQVTQEASTRLRSHLSVRVDVRGDT